MTDAFDRGFSEAKADADNFSANQNRRDEFAAKEQERARRLLEAMAARANGYDYGDRHPGFFAEIDDDGALKMGNHEYSITNVVKVEFKAGKLEMSGFIRQGEILTADLDNEKEVDAIRQRLGKEAYEFNKYHG